MRKQDVFENGSGQNKWLVFALCAAAYFFVMLHRMSTGVIVADLKREFGATAVQLGLLSSLYFYIYAAVQIPVGILTARLGPKRMILGGLGVMITGAFLFAASQSFTFAVVARVVTTIGASTILVPALRLLTEVFGARNFATPSGLIFAIGNAGSLSAATPLALLVQGMGWRGSFLAIAVLTVAIFLLVFFFLRTGHAQAVPVEAAREAAAAAPARRVKDGAPGWWGVALISLMGFMNYGPLMGYSGLWGIPFFMEVHQLERVAASNIITLTPLGSLIGSLLVGLFVDRLRINKPAIMAICYPIATLAWIPLILRTSPVDSGLMPIFAFIMGFASSLAGITALGLLPVWLGNRNQALGLGIFNTCNMGGGAVFQLAMGGVIEWSAQAGLGVSAQYHNAFRFAFVGVAIACLGGLVASGISKARRRAGEAGD